MEFDSSDHELMAVLLYLQWVLDNLEYLQNVENPAHTIYSDELEEIGKPDLRDYLSEVMKKIKK